MAAKKTNGGSFIRHLDKMRHRFGKSAIIVDNVTYHDSRRVRRYLKKNGGSMELLFLAPYSPFLNPAKRLWCKGKARIHRTLRWPAKSYRRKVVFVYESLVI